MLVVLLLAAASASAGQLSWSAPIAVAPKGVDVFGDLSVRGFGLVDTVSCPTTSFCAAVGSDYVVTSTDPTGGSSAWKASMIDTDGHTLVSVSCPTSGFCVALDDVGDVLSSSDPAGGAAAWTLTNAAVSGPSLSCPTSSFCASAGAGDVSVSTDPAGSSAWSSVSVDSDDRISAISCASASLCVAVDQDGLELHTTDPTGGASAWSTPEPIAAKSNSTPEQLNDITCPTTSFCAATDGFDYLVSELYTTGNVITTSDPAGPSTDWTASSALDHGLFPIACTTTLLCTTSDLEDGNSIYESHEPESPTHWLTNDNKGTPSAISCPSASLCVAIDGQRGSTRNILIATSALTNARTSVQIASALAKLLVSPSKSATTALLTHRGVTMPFAAPEAGNLAVQWYELPTNATPDKHHKAKPTLLAAGRTHFAAAGSGTVKISLSSAGIKLIKHIKDAKVQVEASFTPTGGPPAAETTQIVV